MKIGSQCHMLSIIVVNLIQFLFTIFRRYTGTYLCTRIIGNEILFFQVKEWEVFREFHIRLALCQAVVRWGEGGYPTWVLNREVSCLRLRRRMTGGFTLGGVFSCSSFRLENSFTFSAKLRLKISQTENINITNL